MIKFEKVSFEQFSKDYDGDNAGEVYNSIKLPQRATDKSAGYDFFSPIDFVLKPNESIAFPTGVRIFLNPDRVLKIYPRSGLGCKHQLCLANTVGIIDADYSESDNEGHIHMVLVNRGNKVLEVKAGKAIAQGVIEPYYLTDDDVPAGKRNGGFGSTDEIQGEPDAAYGNTPFFEDEQPFSEPDDNFYAEDDYSHEEYVPNEEEYHIPDNEPVHDNENTESEIILYTTHCPICEVLKRKLDAKNVQYRIVDDPDQIERETGFSRAPMLKINGNIIQGLAANNWVNGLA